MAVGDVLQILLSGLAGFSPLNPPTIIFDDPSLANDGIPVVIGSFPVNLTKTYFVLQTFVLRDAVGNLLTVSHRLSIKGDPVLPVIQADIIQNQVSNLTALPIVANAIIGTDMTLTMTLSPLSGSALVVRVYNQIFIGG